MKTPPKLDDESSYENWKRDVKLWTKLTDLDAKKQGIAVYLSLTGQAKDLASEVSEDDLVKPTGVDSIIAKLDGLYLADEGLRKFSSFHKLYNMRRETDIPVSSFISDFEHVFYQFTQYQMTLPDSVKGFMLLSACNLSENERKLVLSGVVDVNYQNIKDSLRRIFATELSTSSKIDIKSEPVLHSIDADNENNDQVLYANKSRGYWRGKRGARGTANRGRFANWRGAGSRGDRTSGNSTAKVQRCFACGSKFHWLKDCPDKDRNDKNYSNDDNEVVHLSLFMDTGASQIEGRNKKLKSLVLESFGHAVLDTGCSSTVCGNEWHDNYVENLSDYDKSKIEVHPSEASFTFGDGSVVKSQKKVVLPCYVAGMRSTITTDVVDCSIPLLLSKQSMKYAKMILHFGSDTVQIGKKSNPLKCSTSGHYLLPIGF